MVHYLYTLWTLWPILQSDIKFYIEEQLKTMQTDKNNDKHDTILFTLANRPSFPDLTGPNQAMRFAKSWSWTYFLSLSSVKIWWTKKVHLTVKANKNVDLWILVIRETFNCNILHTFQKLISTVHLMILFWYTYIEAKIHFVHL